jgi:hypothetical protein
MLLSRNRDHERHALTCNRRVFQRSSKRSYPLPCWSPAHPSHSNHSRDRFPKREVYAREAAALSKIRGRCLMPRIDAMPRISEEGLLARKRQAALLASTIGLRGWERARVFQIAESRDHSCGKPSCKKKAATGHRINSPWVPPWGRGKRQHQSTSGSVFSSWVPVRCLA